MAPDSSKRKPGLSKKYLSVTAKQRSGRPALPASSFLKNAPARESGRRGANFAAHYCGNQAGIDLLLADQHDVRRLHRRVHGFDHLHQTAAFD